MMTATRETELRMVRGRRRAPPVGFGQLVPVVVLDPPVDLWRSEDAPVDDPLCAAPRDEHAAVGPTLARARQGIRELLVLPRVRLGREAQAAGAEERIER